MRRVSDRRRANARQTAGISRRLRILLLLTSEGGAMTDVVREAAIDAADINAASVQTAKVVSAASSIEATIPAPGRDTIGILWMLLVGGLVGAVLLSLAGIIWAVADGRTGTSPDVNVTVFTAALTGLIGLFVKAPAS